MTWRDFVRDVLPKDLDLDDDTADWLLWEHAAFPFADRNYVRIQLEALVVPRIGERTTLHLPDTSEVR